ncbi:MAG: ABC transporter ATP-binding protein/permease [Oscillospiraceae bacterium]|jgi:ATP-binding cassette subfamily B protein|nr:ABC transporter ATP-binding protein/permease [Oscillospiraceae bacterium]
MSSERRQNSSPVKKDQDSQNAAEGKPKNFKNALKDLALYCKRYIPAIIIAFAFSMTGMIFILIGPGKLSEITDLITQGMMTEIDIWAISKIGLFLVTIYLAGAVLSYFQGFIMASVTQKVAHGLREEISKKINKLPFKYFDSTSYGDVLSRVTNDVDTISQTFSQGVSNIAISATAFVGSLIMMLITNTIMTLTAIVATIVGFGLMILIVSRSQKHFVTQQRELGAINGHIEEIYSGHNILKVYNGERQALEKFTDINEKLYESGWKAQFLSGMMMPIMTFIGNFGYVLVCVVGGVLVFNEVISFGVIVAFIVYIRLFTQPMSEFAQIITNLQSTAAATERVFEFLKEEEIEDESHKTKTTTDALGEVEFLNVRFGYNKDRVIINDFSAHIESGQKVAIVGPTGAGKTTIVNLLMRFYELDSGVIKIDGISINEMKREDVHNLFCMVLQDTWLFEGTIKENIIYSKSGVTDEQVKEACKAVGLHHFIMTLPKGYDTILNDKAALSMGQKQLMTIARAMIENAPLLILDEATSSVDTRTEILIQKAMDKLTVGRTSFVIAHRLSTIKNADLILVLNRGDIVESGTHSELIDRDGFYKDLYNSQFEQIEV